MDLTKKPEDLNESQSLYAFGAFSPSKRLKLNPSKEKFELHNSAQIIADTADRYGTFAKTARNKSVMKNNKGNPPKLSPRATNRSVEPNMRSNNFLMGKTSPTYGD